GGRLGDQGGVGRVRRLDRPGPVGEGAKTRLERGHGERAATLGGDLDAQDERLAARRIRWLGHRDSFHHRRRGARPHPPRWAYRTRDTAESRLLTLFAWRVCPPLTATSANARTRPASRFRLSAAG